MDVEMNPETAPESVTANELLKMTSEVVAAYLRNNPLPAAQVSEIIGTVYSSLRALSDRNGEMPAEPLKPAVAIRKSIGDDYIICLEDGKKLKMLKRHLRTNYNMTPDEYRAKWNLPADYPMVAPSYAKQRSAFAKKIGLGKSGSRGRRASA
ncbi:putative transcriptional regulator, Ros/MucR family protein [Oceanibaculum indicum P24]|uniref:Putative transcriptional regulator, Ros/MucR family protein n=2 Tax=Oceanibaculum indicum TaxID=526216 RepID=K2JT84_9PROT|nr:putative transcriptional regulator, Ros/MucR family protein [Oceanibaculum indicum P24]